MTTATGRPTETRSAAVAVEMMTAVVMEFLRLGTSLTDSADEVVDPH